MRLDGKRVLLTGGTRGIGHGLALALARAGARLVTCYRSDEDAAKLLAAELDELGEHKVVRADVTDAGDVAALIDECGTYLGGLDVLVSNAGTISHVPFGELAVEEWQRVLDTNLTSMYRLVRQALPLLGEGASVIGIGSRSAFVGIPQRAHYTAAKAGLVGLVRSLAKELGPRGIRVNLVSPGVIDPGDGTLPEPVRQRYEGLTALGRLGTPEEVAGPVLFLAGDQAGYVTGETIHVDGGI
ncbi:MULTISPECIES: SDR family NAD(P)-dependent oxidoreductase [unclassified Nonomuraea]|uniref:SDR family oxidoreductase n=1 Tax=unclassified Nonomuraea TaxID=2593643 RepID=UPI0034108266